MIGQSLGTRWRAASPDARMYSASAASRPPSAESRPRRSAVSTLSAASSGNTVALIGSALLFASASSSRKPLPHAPTRVCTLISSGLTERDHFVKRATPAPWSSKCPRCSARLHVCRVPRLLTVSVPATFPDLLPSFILSPIVIKNLVPAAFFAFLAFLRASFKLPPEGAQALRGRRCARW